MGILPYPEQPIFLSYHDKAFPFGIVQANAPESFVKWVCGKCVGRVVFDANTSAHKFDMEIDDIWGNYEGVTTQQIFNLKKDMIKRLDIDLVFMFRTFLDQGCYFYGNYNEKHIPNKWAYGIRDFMHDFMIIGYDDENFYSVGYVADGRFKHFAIPVKNFLNSLEDTDRSRINIGFISYNHGVTLKPNYSGIIKALKEYITPCERVKTSNESEALRGVLALEGLRNMFILEQKNERPKIDKRYTRVLYEHEWIMDQLVELFLGEEGKCLREITKSNLQIAQHVHLMTLKLEYRYSLRLISRIGDCISSIIETEREYIPTVVELFEAKYSLQ